MKYCRGKRRAMSVAGHQGSTEGASRERRESPRERCGHQESNEGAPRESSGASKGLKGYRIREE